MPSSMHNVIVLAHVIILSFMCACCKANLIIIIIVIVHPRPAQKQSLPCTLRSEIRKIGQYNPIYERLRRYNVVLC